MPLRPLLVAMFCVLTAIQAAAIPGVRAEQLHMRATGPEYGLAVLDGASPYAPGLALFMLFPDGQQLFARHGFSPVALPAPPR